mgnify:CR=1 FL=1
MGSSDCVLALEEAVVGLTCLLDLVHRVVCLTDNFINTLGVVADDGNTDTYIYREMIAGIAVEAVLEGVMMKAGKHTVTTCRKDDGSIVVYDDEFVSVRKKHKFLKHPS